MRIFISGLYSGPNPSSGVGVARSLREAYPGATLIGVDYSPRSSGLHDSVFDEIWLQRPWDELGELDDLKAYGQQIKELLDAGAYWISGLDIETLWLSNDLPGHPNLLAPEKGAWNKIAKPDVKAHAGLPMKIPPYCVTSEPDSTLYAFCRRHGWRVWLKGPFYQARRIRNWHEFKVARDELARTWSADELILQAHESGYEESIILCAFKGELLSCAHMEKRDVTSEGKTWAGKVAPVPDDILWRLREVVADLNWTGGAELEYIRDQEGDQWLLEWNPRFPAWVYGATLAGFNLPALLIERASQVPASPSKKVADEFVRVVFEIPVRSQFPLLPVSEPSNSRLFDFSAKKHPSGMPMLAKRLKKRDMRHKKVASPETPGEEGFLQSIVQDISQLDFEPVKTPEWIFLEGTAHSLFSDVASFVRQFDSHPIRVEVAYSMKTNPDDRLISLARRSGFMIEAISQLELRRAIRSGYPYERVILNGPGKWWGAGRSAAKPVGALFADSLEEVKQLVAESRRNSLPAAVIGIRIRPSNVDSRFGIAVDDYESFEQLTSLIGDLPDDCSVGIHFHLASSEVGVPPWLRLFESMLKWAQSIEAISGKAVTSLDIGGGWFPDDWKQVLMPSLPELLSNASQSLPSLNQFILEPGKALAQPAVALAVRILEVRSSQGDITEVVVDGSTAELPEIGHYPHRILRLDRVTGRWELVQRGNTRILGRLCMENDILADEVSLPPYVQESDILIFCDVGAYDRSQAYVFGQG